MRSTHLVLSATDLANHLACSHRATLDQLAARGIVGRPRHNVDLELLEDLGRRHEAAYLEHLQSRGRTIHRIDTRDPSLTAERATRQAMHAGADVIAQATLMYPPFFGRADVLLRIAGTETSLGTFGYEPVDTKLSTHTRATTLMQLGVYAELVAAIQGNLPERVHVVTPRTEFVPDSYRTAEIMAYVRRVRDRLLASARGEPPPEAAERVVDPVEHCDVCRWWSRCAKARRDADHLSLVAGISARQRQQFERWNVTTLAELGALPDPIEAPARGSRAAYLRVRDQAAVQLRGRQLQRPVHELLPRTSSAPELASGDAQPRGFARLPEPAPGDMFFDIEGDPFVDEHGLEYLFGWVVGDDDAEPRYQAAWALDAATERQAFERFVDSVMARWQADRAIHVYHFAPYEPSAIKRLMLRHDTRHDEVDAMLRQGVFVDLLAVVREAMRASVESYSLKHLEAFYEFDRNVTLASVGPPKRRLEAALQRGLAASISAVDREIVEGYNRDDCISTLRLRDWLEALRSELVASGEAVPRFVNRTKEPEKKIRARDAVICALSDRLVQAIPDDPAVRDRPQRATWLLAQLLRWHHRETKVKWWENYRLAELEAGAMHRENAGVGGLRFVAANGGTAKCPIHRYTFDRQDTTVRVGDSLRAPGGDPVGTVTAVDTRVCILEIKKAAAARDVHPAAVYALESVASDVLEAALVRLATWVAEHGLDATGPHRAARDLLLGRAPRFTGGFEPDRERTAPLLDVGEDVVKRACVLGLALSGGVLGIQGPPGAGKTHTGARMIVELVRAGKTVGVSAVSHKVIGNLLRAAVAAAATEGVELRCLQKVSKRPPDVHEDPIRLFDDNKKLAAAFAAGEAPVMGGTAWLWAREAMHQAVDVLVVDEAGQMSLANVLAVAQGATSLVLLGDPQQLEQPQRAAHPEGTDVSALQHLLGEHATMPAHQGLFLAHTRRLHPSLTRFTSELFYEGRLHAHPSCARQELRGDSPFVGAGHFFVPVTAPHTEASGPTQGELEAEVVTQLVRHFVDTGLRLVDPNGHKRPLGLADLLIIAPYNLHVDALTHALPANARVGTIDRFQGQEAAVVISSMSAASTKDAPRGLEFLFDHHRLNVATSRARTTCVLVGNPGLFAAHCKTPAQLRMCNAMCRYLELATVVDGGWGKP